MPHNHQRNKLSHWYMGVFLLSNQPPSREKYVGDDRLLHFDNILLIDGVCSVPCSSGSFEFHPEWAIGNFQQSHPPYRENYIGSILYVYFKYTSFLLQILEAQ